MSTARLRPPSRRMSAWGSFHGAVRSVTERQGERGAGFARVHQPSVGVGTPGGAEIQMINEQGKQELVRDTQGQVVRSRLDESTLHSIAQATHGAYYPLGPLGEGLAPRRGTDGDVLRTDRRLGAVRVRRRHLRLRCERPASTEPPGAECRHGRQSGAPFVERRDVPAGPWTTLVGRVRSTGP